MKDKLKNAYKFFFKHMGERMKVRVIYYSEEDALDECASYNADRIERHFRNNNPFLWTLPDERYP